MMSDAMDGLYEEDSEEERIIQEFQDERDLEIKGQLNDATKGNTVKNEDVESLLKKFAE